MINEPTIDGDTISIPSNPNHIIAVDEFVESRLREMAVDESTIADIAISVTEVVNNGIVHGNKSDPEKILTVTIIRKGNDVKFVVTDHGAGFDPETIRNPLDEENLLREAGRGIFIARSLMDDVDINPSPTGVTVTLTKTL